MNIDFTLGVRFLVNRCLNGSISVLFVFILIFLALTMPVNAGVTIEDRSSDGIIAVDVRESSLHEITTTLASHFDIKIEGKIDEASAYSANFTGSVKTVLEQLFGENNFILVYDNTKLEKLIVLNGSDDVLANSTGVQKFVINNSKAGNDQSEQVNSQTTTNTNQVQTPETAKAVTTATNQLIHSINPEANNNVANSPNIKWDGKGQPPKKLASQLQKNSSDNLQALVEALKALCPTGSRC